MLFTYYLFLIAGLVLLAAFRNSTVFSEPRRAHISYLLVAPLILLVSAMGVGLMGTVLLTLAVTLVGNGLLRRYSGAAVTRQTLYYCLGIWLVEAILPAAIHLGLRSRPNAETRWLVISAIGLMLATILLLAVWAPDVRKET